jgi:Universal stress protein family
MNSIGSLLVHLDNTKRSEVKLDFALAIKNKLDGLLFKTTQINALYLPPTPYFPFPNRYSEDAASIVSPSLALFEQQAQEAKRQFDRWNTQHQMIATWVERDGELAVPTMVNQSLFNDLLILGQYDDQVSYDINMPSDFVQHSVIESGKPTIILPSNGRFNSVATNVLVAWKPTRESSNALRAAIPMLQASEAIHFIADTPANDQLPQQLRIESYLRSNAVSAKLTYHPSNDTQSAPERILTLAGNIGADLLVMGCYGHSRLRELLLGGVTKTILSSMNLPVFMVH